jgi:hypothetical protein
MEQKIEGPTDEDIDYIARMLIYAAEITEEIAGIALAENLDDLDTLQRVIDSKLIDRESTQALQALGLAFGKVFVNETPGYDWWMVEDEFGRDPAIRYKETTLMAFPQTMISKRVEDDEKINLKEMYFGLQHQLERIRVENYPDA